MNSLLTKSKSAGIKRVIDQIRNENAIETSDSEILEKTI